MTIRKGERRGTTMIDRRPVNQTGARKATGSYFTKDFAVAHLLDQALEPALAGQG
jgi:hypothetical protein